MGGVSNCKSGFSVCVSFPKAVWSPVKTSVCQILPFCHVCHRSSDGICVHGQFSFAFAGSLAHFVPSMPACDIHRGLRKGQWSTLCVWILHSKKLFEPWSFGIILIKLPCYSQNGNQVSIKLCQTMSWTRAWQQMPYEIQAPSGQLVHEDIYWITRHDNLIVGETNNIIKHWTRLLLLLTLWPFLVISVTKQSWISSQMGGQIILTIHVFFLINELLFSDLTRLFMDTFLESFSCKIWSNKCK